MSDHEDKVVYEEKPNLLLIAFSDPETFQSSAPHVQIVEIFRCLDRFCASNTLLSLFRTEVVQLLLGGTTQVGSFEGLIQHNHEGLLSGPHALTLQLGVYILFSSRYHIKLQTAGTLLSGVNRSASLSYGLGTLASIAVRQSKTSLDLVKNAVVAIQYAFAVEAKIPVPNDLLSLEVKTGSDANVIKNILDVGKSLSITSVISSDEYIITGHKYDINLLVQHCEAHLDRTNSWHWVVPSILSYVTDDVLSQFPQWPFDTPHNSEWDLFLGDGKGCNLLRRLSDQQMLGDKGLHEIGRLIHSTTDNIIDGTSLGLVDVLCIGPWNTFESSLTERLRNLDARVRSTDLVSMLLRAESYTDVDYLPNEYSYINFHPQTHVAILGYSLRVPGASDPGEFWDLLVQGKDKHSEIPTELFDLESYHNAQYRVTNTMRTRNGNFLENPGLFDTEIFNITKEQAEQMDPQHRNAFLAAHEALEMSGYSPFGSLGLKSHPENVGVFVGGAGDDYRENCSWKIEKGFIAGNSRQSVSGNISNFFGFHGPSHTYDTACSSSLVAVEAACQNIVNGRCSSAIAGGVSVITQPQVYIGKLNFCVKVQKI